MDSGTPVLVTCWRIWNRQRQRQKSKKHVDWQGRVILQDFTQIWDSFSFIVTSEMNANITSWITKKEWHILVWLKLLLVFSAFIHCFLSDWMWSMCNLITCCWWHTSTTCTSGAADPVLHCRHWVCSLHIHHCLVWIGHQTGQEQTTTDSQVCRKDHRCQPAHHPRSVHLQSQETVRKNHCRPLTPRTQTFQTPPLW